MFHFSQSSIFHNLPFPSLFHLFFFLPPSFTSFPSLFLFLPPSLFLSSPILLSYCPFFLPLTPDLFNCPLLVLHSLTCSTRSTLFLNAGVCSPPEGFLSLLSPALVYRGMILIHQMLEDIIDQVKVSDALFSLPAKIHSSFPLRQVERRDVPVVLVGGGSVLVDTALPLKGVSKLVIPKYSQVSWFH